MNELSKEDREKLQQCAKDARQLILERKRRSLKTKTAELDWTDQKDVDYLTFRLAYQRGLKHKLR